MLFSIRHQPAAKRHQPAANINAPQLRRFFGRLHGMLVLGSIVLALLGVHILVKHREVVVSAAEAVAVYLLSLLIRGKRRLRLERRRLISKASDRAATPKPKD